MIRLVPVLFLMVFSVSMVSAGVDLRETLGDETFRESGLEKLSPSELAHLSEAVAELLGDTAEKVRVSVKEEVRDEVKDEVRTEVEEEVRQQVAEEMQIPQGDDRFGLETVKDRVAKLFQGDAPKVIESRIPGDFKGWRGKTVFRLENGQVWRQTNPDTFVVHVRDPKVTIRRGMFGSYLLKIDGYNSSVKVERIK